MSGTYPYLSLFPMCQEGELIHMTPHRNPDLKKVCPGKPGSMYLTEKAMRRILFPEV